MSDNAEVVFTANAKGMLDEYKKLEKANEQLTQKLIAAMKVSKQAANEETKLRKEVTAAIEKSRTPAEAYIATINRYKQALQAGMITADQFNRIRDVELAKINAGNVALQKQAAAEQDAATKKAAAHQQSMRNAAEAKSIQEAMKQENALRQVTASALQKIQTPAQAYNATLTQYKQALQSGIITQEQFNKLRDKELSKLNASNAALDKTTTAVKALNQEKVVGTGATAKYAEGFAMIATKALLATAAVKSFLAEKKRMQDEAEGTVASIDDLSRDYAIQGGLKTEDQRKEATAKILKVARDNASTPSQAFGTASQLASSGFDAPTGESLDSALKIIKTSDMAKADPKGYIDAAAKFLKASNQKLTGQNLLGIGVAMRGLVDTPVQASDLAEFSAAAPVLNMQGVDWQTGLGMMTELRRAMSGSESGTKMRNIAQRLATASTDKQATGALEELGLKPEDVDAVGESMPNALRTLRDAVDRQPIKKRAGLMGRIFNNENVAAADVLMKNIDAVDKNVAAMSDGSIFTAGVNFQLQGHNAEKNRAEIDKQMKQMEDAEATTRRTVLLKEVEINRIEKARRQGIGKNVLDSVWQTKDDLMYGVGAVSDDELLQRSRTGFQVFNGYESEEQRRQTIGRLDKSGQAFTEADLRGRINGGAVDAAPIVEAINKQTQVLSGKLTPAPKPTVNPNLQGRP